MIKTVMDAEDAQSITTYQADLGGDRAVGSIIVILLLSKQRRRKRKKKSQSKKVKKKLKRVKKFAIVLAVLNAIEDLDAIESLDVPTNIEVVMRVPLMTGAVQAPLKDTVLRAQVIQRRVASLKESFTATTSAESCIAILTIPRAIRRTDLQARQVKKSHQIESALGRKTHQVVEGDATDTHLQARPVKNHQREDAHGRRKSHQATNGDARNTPHQVRVTAQRAKKAKDLCADKRNGREDLFASQRRDATSQRRGATNQRRRDATSQGRDAPQRLTGRTTEDTRDASTIADQRSAELAHTKPIGE